MNSPSIKSNQLTTNKKVCNENKNQTKTSNSDKSNYFKLYDENYFNHIQNLFKTKLNYKQQKQNIPNDTKKIDFTYLQKILRLKNKQNIQQECHKNTQLSTSNNKNQYSTYQLTQHKKSASTSCLQTINTKIQKSPEKKDLMDKNKKQSLYQTPKNYFSNVVSPERKAETPKNQNFMNQYHKHLSDYEKNLNKYLKKSDEIIKNRECSTQKMQDQKNKLFNSLKNLLSVTNQYKPSENKQQNTKPKMTYISFIEKNKKQISRIKKKTVIVENVKQRPIDKYFKIKQKITKQFKLKT